MKEGGVINDECGLIMSLGFRKEPTYHKTPSAS